MSLEWGPATQAAAKRLADAISASARNKAHRRLAERAAKGEFTDYSDAHTCPITTLYSMCRRLGLNDIADRLKNGDFDATPEESDEWARSSSGQSAFAKLSPAMRKSLGDPNA